MQLKNPLGLVFTFSSQGAIDSIDAIGRVEADAIRIGLRPPTPFSRVGANIYLRKRGSRTYTTLLGPIILQGKYQSLESRYIDFLFGHARFRFRV